MKKINQLLSDLDITSVQDIYDLQNRSVDEIKESDGEMSALELSIRAKGLVKVLEGYLKQIAAEALAEAERQISQKTKTFEMLGASITVGEVGVKWNYEKTNDPKMAELTGRAKELKKEIDIQAKFLQNISSPLDLVNPDTGEVIKVFPAYKTGTTSIKVSFGKDDE